MKTEWDYTDLADAYLKRPEYSSSAIDQMLARAGVKAGASICDIGAGAGHLTIPLAERGFRVTAIEPNDAMRAHGIQRTKRFDSVKWQEASAESTGQPDHAFAMVTFGSSFNVTDRPKALKESARLLQAGGWFACLWNHRDLRDPLQSRIEAVIKEHVPGYSYGTRREDQTDVINSSGLFGRVEQIEGSVLHSVDAGDWFEAWRSHATLQRQAGDAFGALIAEFDRIRCDVATATITVPYQTCIWMAPLR